MIHGHGGNIYAASAALGCLPGEIADMSSNINPLGPMPGLLEHLACSIKQICRLPEVDARQISDKYAAWQDIDSGYVSAGAGTSEFLYLLPRILKSRSAVVAGPTYADYADALAINKTRCHWVLRKNNDYKFMPDFKTLKKAAQNADMVFFCNPNNPTGEITDSEKLLFLARSFSDTVFIIDESYMPFAPAPQSLARTGLPNIIVLQSLSKMYAIPGLRIGFCVSPENITSLIRNHCPPWSVNSLAQEAVRFITDNCDQAMAHEKSTRQYLSTQRDEITRKLSTVPGLYLYPAAATFILMRAKYFRAGQLARHMLNHRILIRDCGNFYGMDDHYFRISLKDPETNQKAARLIKNFAKQKAEAGRGAEN